MLPPQPLVGAPVHPLGLLRERLRHVRATSEPFSDGLRLVKCPVHLIVPLALVDQSVAMAAQEVAPRPVQDCHPPAACRSGADEPRTLSTEVAGGPLEGHGLLHAFPLLPRSAPVAVEEQYPL